MFRDLHPKGRRGAVLARDARRDRQRALARSLSGRSHARRDPRDRPRRGDRPRSKPRREHANEFAQLGRTDGVFDHLVNLSLGWVSLARLPSTSPRRTSLAQRFALFPSPRCKAPLETSAPAARDIMRKLPAASTRRIVTLTDDAMAAAIPRSRGARHREVELSEKKADGRA